MTCEQARLDLGVYVVGALDAGERARLDEHLAGCAACRDELAELAGLPGLLGRLQPAEAVAGPPTPGPSLYEQLRARALATRRRRRQRIAAASLAAAVALSGAAAAVAVVVAPAGHNPTKVTVTDAATHVTASFTLRGASTGTAIDLTLSHVPPQEQCELIAVPKTGATAVAGSWTANYEGDAVLHGSVAIPRNQISELEVVTFSGTPLVVAHL